MLASLLTWPNRGALITTLVVLTIFLGLRLWFDESKFDYAGSKNYGSKKHIVNKSSKKHLLPQAIVSGSSSNHFETLLVFLDNLHRFNPSEIPIFIYDLGLNATEHERIVQNYTKVILRPFLYDKYPDYFNINIAGGEYAWKPVIIKEMLDSTAFQVLWLDSGDRLTDPSNLDVTFEIIGRNGFVSTETSGTTQQWVHPLTRTHFHAETMDEKMCNGAIIGFERNHTDVYSSIVVPWAVCALQRHCIAPEGSSRANHRQDQATLTVLIHKWGRRCASTLGILLHQDVQVMPPPLPTAPSNQTFNIS